MISSIIIVLAHTFLNRCDAFMFTPKPSIGYTSMPSNMITSYEKYGPIDVKLGASGLSVLCMKRRNSQPNNLWDKSKDRIYGFIDAAYNVGYMINKKKSQENVSFGYKDQIESQKPSIEPANTDNIPDPDFLLRQYEGMKRMRQVGVTNVLPLPEGPSSFENFKTTLFDFFDFASSIMSVEKNSSKTTSTVVKKFPAISKKEYDSSLAMQILVNDLNNNDPFFRFQTKWKIWKLARDLKATKRREQRIALFEKIKEVVYGAVDFTINTRTTITNTGRTLSSLPDNISTFAEQVQKSLTSNANNVKSAIEEIQETPSKVAKKFDEVKLSYKKNKELVEVVAGDIVGIPSVLKTTVAQKKKDVKETIETVQNIPKQVKVALGIEKLPPPPPPPPPTKTKVALNLFGSALKAGAKVTFFVGKGAAVLGYQGIKAVAKTAISQVNEKKQESKDVRVNNLKSNVVQSNKVVKDTKEIDKELEKEVNDALELAAKALSMSDEGSGTINEFKAGMKKRESQNFDDAKELKINRNENTSNASEVREKLRKKDVDVAIEIEESLKRAKAAASRVASDAEAIEAMLRRKK